MKKNIKLILLTILLLLFVANRLFFFKPSFLEQWCSYITYPALWISSTITNPIKRIIQKHRSYEELESYCTQLRTELDKLEKENIALNATLHYHIKSKDLQNFQTRYNLKDSILATVLVKTLAEEEHSIIVNKGSCNGIEKDMVAIYKLQLIGKVTDVFPWYSKVRLITDTQSKIAAHTNTNNAQGIVQGNNSINKCSLSYITHLAKLNKDDFVLSSGQGLVFPEGFCLGKITSFKKEGVCYQIEIEPLVDLTKLETCLITNQSKMNLL